MSVLVIGTFDTKGSEFAFVRDLLLAQGVAVLTANAGTLGEPSFKPDISSREILSASGVKISDISDSAGRGPLVTTAAQGAAVLAAKLFKEGRISAVLGLGGSAGTLIGTAAMRVLPYGVPKLMVSTLASGQVQKFVGESDILMLHSVVDFCGLNRFSKQILCNAANAMVGMVRGRLTPTEPATDKPLLAATMFGVTTPCVERGREIFDASGFETLVFHATGTGGRTMEAMVRDGLISGVFDITTTELADELVGGILSAGRDRLTAASLRKVPQVISVGALDMVNFGPPETVPEKFRDRRFYQHNPLVTLMRTTPEENDALGKEIAEKASASGGPVAILLPRKGISAIDQQSGPFWWPEADQALFQSIHNWIGPWVPVIEADLHINDPAFAELAAETLLKLLRKSK